MPSATLPFALFDKVHADGPGPLGADAAAESLAAIRRYMERGTEFSGYSAGAGLAAGVAGFAGAGWLLARHGLAVPPVPEFAVVWGLAAVVALVGAVLSTARKARIRGEALWSRPTRLVLTACAAPWGAAALLGAVEIAHGDVALLPGLWLLCYGAGVWAAALCARREFQVVGAAAIALGAVALLAPVAWGSAVMGIGFGGIHLVAAAIAASLERREHAADARPLGLTR